MSKPELDPKFAAIIHASTDLFGALERYTDPAGAVARWTENERGQAFDYIRAIRRNLTPWYQVIRKARKRQKK